MKALLVPRRLRGGSLAVLASVALVAATLSAAPASSEPTAPASGSDAAVADPVKETAGNDPLGERDRALLAEAIADGDENVTMILATDAGSADEVEASVERLGGTVGMRSQRIGYVRASVPTGKVLKTAYLPGVDKVDLNETIKQPDPRLEGRAGRAATAAGPGAGTPDDNPYMPTNETGAVAFKQNHPTYDGRGVTIGVLDSGVDLDHPALSTTSTGERKIVDWVTATDPLEDATWRAMLTQVTGPTFTYAGSTWKAPAGTYRINRFSESITAGSEPAGDVNRDGDTTDRWGVLYNPATHDVWVDVDQDFDFTDETAMRPYREDFQVGHFGTDNPATTEVVESMPFVVQYREDVDTTPAGLPGVADFVNIGIPEDAHGSHVAGIAAGHSLFGGQMDGAAPGAQIVSSRACTWGGGCTAVALTEGMIDLVTNRGVDVVNMSIGGLPALNDANNARAELYDRLIDEYGVQLIFSIGNSGPGLNTAGDPGVVTDVIGVASSISKETWAANYGSVVSSKLNLHNYSSRGPREDGGFKPDLMAPGSAISTVPRWLKQPDVAEAGYALPPGYAMFNGTSMASPQTAGAAALLLSAAFQTDTAVTPAQLRTAMETSADFVKGLPAVAQGHGQLDVPSTWSLLKKEPEVRDYTVSAPVCTPISQFLATPDRGTGVYNRCAAGDGGQAAGSTRTYQVRVTRTSGPARAIRHRLELVGNDGTFSAPSSVSLPLGTAVTIPVVASPSAGMHSAILRIDDPGTALIDHTMLATVVAPTPLRAPSYATTTTSRVERNLTQSIFVTVPEGARALQVNLGGIATGSQTRFIAINPYGVPVESTSSLVCYTNFSDPADCKPTSRAYADPLPGVWEIEVESRRTTPSLNNPYRLTAAVQGVTVSPETLELASVEAGTPTPVSWTVTNAFGPVTVHGEGGPLGSAHSARPSIADHATAEYTVEVPAGADALTATIGNPSDLSADLDLSVYLGDTLVGQTADGDSEESVTITSPAAGTYTVVVDGYSVPAGTTEYDYLDVFFSPALGELTVDDSAHSLAGGQSVEIGGSLTAQQAPAAGRSLFGEMRVVSTEGAVLGTGAVQIGEVTTP
ncbi:S8 family serine peptidase [Nocardioides sp. MAH-18]|uniref:S8 family serine peptidase n=1 Tax=Nocardioides agri TaxID=2682843 RepID=A0A6L6XMQ3_9ACTN|nr:MULTISPECIES: S8 family serine peptidase [unclassified Nocardioides]MBA2953158.1 S8 family serine peptidase [Nocardioides sp. CGMCC 1.13656]MVQ48027.1 S8 family serine peptidase [Nocardioides sp. MAH-18]